MLKYVNSVSGYTTTFSYSSLIIIMLIIIVKKPISCSFPGNVTLYECPHFSLTTNPWKQNYWLYFINEST